MSMNPLRSIVIVGGGTAGWMAAAALARFLQDQPISVRLIESEEIGTVGVGEATVPMIQIFNEMLGINELEFIKYTRATFKLGIQFRDWGKLGNRYFHAFGDFGESINGIAPHHYWLKLKKLGDTNPIGDYSFPTVASQFNRFAPPPTQGHAAMAIAGYKYAYHFDAALYAGFLRKYSEQRGVIRQEGKVIDVKLCNDNGFIESICMDTEESISADFFIDCTGFRGRLIEQALQTGYQNWSHWLPCNSAVVAPCALAETLSPYTISTAREAGWQWRIPLQHRVGNGYVYSTEFTSDQHAESCFRRALEGDLLADPRVLRFVTGHRKKFWNKNCLALGLSAGFLEPLESSSIQLIQTGIARLIEFFPDCNFDSVMVDEYNRITEKEYEGVRDFLILHYCLGERNDADLWRYCREMVLPDSLRHKINLFNSCGRISLTAEDSYAESSWVSIFLGLNNLPKRYDPLVDCIDAQHLVKAMRQRREAIFSLTQGMPAHEQFISKILQP